MAEIRCRVCGCTDARACVDEDTGETCYWIIGGVAGPICSFCAEVKDALREALDAGMDRPDGSEPLVEIYSEGEAQAFIRARGASA